MEPHDALLGDQTRQKAHDGRGPSFLFTIDLTTQYTYRIIMYINKYPVYHRVVRRAGEDFPQQIPDRSQRVL